MCEVLISGRADPNAKAADGQTALHIAAYHYDAEVRWQSSAGLSSAAGGARTAQRSEISEDRQ